MVKENPLWQAERIRGELLKLGIQVAKRTIQRYLRRIKPSPAINQTWSIFLHNHANDICTCDFLPVIDLTFRTLCFFFIIEFSSCRVVHFGVMRHPTQQWVAQQLREATPNGVHPQFLLRDNDSNFGTAFDRVARGTGLEVLNIPYRVPRANAVCERFLGSVRRECLDHLLIFTDRQLYRVVREYVGYFNHARTHQGLDQQIPAGEPVQGEIPAKGKVIPFPSLPGREGGERNAAREEGAAAGPSVKGTIIAFTVLNGLHHAYRRSA